MIYNELFFILTYKWWFGPYICYFLVKRFSFTVTICSTGFKWCWLWLPYCLHFHFSWKTKKKGPFFAKNEKKTKKKIILMKIDQNCIQLNKCYKYFHHLTGKNFYTNKNFLLLFIVQLCWTLYVRSSQAEQQTPPAGKRSP